MGILNDLYNQTRLHNKDDHKESKDDTQDKATEESVDDKKSEEK